MSAKAPLARTFLLIANMLCQQGRTALDFLQLYSKMHPSLPRPRAALAAALAVHNLTHLSDAITDNGVVQVETLKADLQQQAAVLQSEKDNALQEVSPCVA